MWMMNKELKEAYKRAKELEKYYSQFPDWYWRSLHDAEITRFETEENLCDYKNDRHNRFSIYLNTSNVLGDRSVKEIHFYNYKFINPPFINFEYVKDCWWLDDELKQLPNGIYRLNIDLESFDGHIELVNFEFSFKRIEVVRTEKIRW